MESRRRCLQPIHVSKGHIQIKVIGHSIWNQTKMSWVDDTMESQYIYQITAETIILVLVATMATFGQCKTLIILFVCRKTG